MVYITAHARTSDGSVEVALEEDVFLTRDILQSALQQVDANNVVILSDFCRSESFNFDLDHPKCVLWMTACGREQSSFNLRRDNGFFTKCLIYGMYCKQICPAEKKSFCQICANFRMQCPRTGLLKWRPLFEYAKNHVVEMVQEMNCAPSVPTFWCSDESELYPLRIMPPLIEVWVGDSKKHEWLCSTAALKRIDATLIQMIREKFEYIFHNK